MVTTVRQGVFETNSSSSHSISIKIKPFKKDNSLMSDFEDTITIETGEFGWGWDKYNDAYTKASYFLTYYFDNEDKKDMLIRVISKNCPCNTIKFVNDEYSYIDHQSWDILDEIHTEEELENFIFNKNSWLFIGNDNDDPPNGFYNV